MAKRGARIIIVNHFQSTNPLIAKVEQWLCPLCTKLGWRSDLALADLSPARGCRSTIAIGWKAWICGETGGVQQQIDG